MRLSDTAFDVNPIPIHSPHPLLRPRSLYILDFLSLTLLLSSPLNLTLPLILTPTLTLTLAFLSSWMIPLSLCPLLTMSILLLSFPVNRCLILPPSPFASLDLPPVLGPVYKVSYDTQGLPVPVPLPFSPSRPFNPLTTAFASSTLVSALLPTSPLIADSGCTGLLLRLVSLPCLKPFFSPHSLPVVPFTLPDGSSLSAGGLSHVTGFLTFPHKLNPVPCYFLPLV
jgi:hypothetical protein